MVITWHPCRHIVYTSDNEDQSDWQWLSVVCPDCGCIGVNVDGGVIQEEPNE